jgi:uncharacterized membrane protein YedE/YeeE
MYELSDLQFAAVAGFAGGMLLGLAARLGRFCVMGAIEDAVYGDDFGRARMVAMAIAVAITGTFLLVHAGLLDPNATRYFRQGWSPAGSVVGGLMFGIGMALVGTCAFGALARAGGGDLRGLIMAGTVGIGALATTGGPIQPFRLWLVPKSPLDGAAADHGIAHWAEALGSIPPLLTALFIAAALAGWALQDSRFCRPSGYVVWSVAAGLAIVWGWATTAHLSVTSFSAIEVESYSFVAPSGQSLIYLMTSASSDPDFAVGGVAGVMSGAALGALIKREFRWEACDDARELRRQLLGALLMGIGGVLAVGCTIGQGLSAFSVLSISAPLTLVAIVTGARIGLFMLVEGILRPR